MTVDSADVARILAALDESTWEQAEIVVGDVRIAVGRHGLPSAATPPTLSSVAAPEPAQPRAVEPEPVARAATETARTDDHVINSPSVGVFWRAPSPGAAPFVEVGAGVSAGDTIGIVEVMKLMNNVVTTVAGTVTAVFPANAEQVEAGTPLVAIRMNA
ncbi:biotin/lipoyl-containing protein [Saccharomonospora sp. NPDC046836]|uniref:acetyl-CoA carboxylase biotin carboxyl carrier protein n=1 Tax=Saccharomonospora sp. NPDC046836 TaxID=3156921 RepID=UPI0033E011B9